jgi:hypothetical protein
MRFAKLLVLLSLFIGRDAPASTDRQPRVCHESGLSRSASTPRVVAWAEALPAVDVKNVTTRVSGPVRLYAPDGAVDETQRKAFERIASGVDGAERVLAVRLEQLVMKAAYRFNGARILIVSGWRSRAGRHGTGEALDFRLEGVRAARLAAYLRTLPRVGVGIYTHPRTQFVHLDVRDTSFHWVDGSPPGIHWRESPLRDNAAEKIDPSWTADMDLP